jgi:hypothetical protein
MNFGQTLLWHVVLIPIVLIAIVGAHVLLVRVRGVAHPIDSRRDEGGTGSWLQRRRAIAAAEAAPWRGPTRRYDIIKEGSITVLITACLTLALAGILSTPDVPALTVQTWSRLDPSDFLGTDAAGDPLPFCSRPCSRPWYASWQSGRLSRQAAC